MRSSIFSVAAVIAALGWSSLGNSQTWRRDQDLVGKTLHVTGSLCHFEKEGAPSHFYLYGQMGRGFYVKPGDEAQARELAAVTARAATRPACQPIDLYGTFSTNGSDLLFDLDMIEDAAVKVSPAGVYLVTEIGAHSLTSSLAQHVMTMRYVKEALESDRLSEVHFVNEPGSTAHGLVAIVTSLHSIRTIEMKLASLNLMTRPRIQRLDLEIDGPANTQIVLK